MLESLDVEDTAGLAHVKKYVQSIKVFERFTSLPCLMMSRGVEVQAGELFENKNVSLQRNVKCVNSCNKIIKMLFIWG